MAITIYWEDLQVGNVRELGTTSVSASPFATLLKRTSPSTRTSRAGSSPASSPW